MSLNLFEKIISSHLVSGELKKGSEITIRIDQTLTQDATGTMTYLQMESMKPVRLATELSVSYIDHNTTQIGFENSDDHQYLKTIAQKYGIYFSRAGNGICHQVHLERFGVPGKTLLGSDSHTPTGGGIGMIAIGAGGLDVAIAMVKGTISFAYPGVTNIFLEGSLRPWVAAKDVILKILEILSSKGNVGTVIEYSGPGIKTLTVPERATITNMGAELGVTTSIFPSDEQTLQFLKAQKRENEWIKLESDKDAEYEKTIKLNLSEIEPLVAKPHSPDNISLVKEIGDLKVDQVVIGSCTNSSYRDFIVAAHMLKNQRVNQNVSFIVAPGSRQVLKMLAENGILSTLIDSGARIAECTCGFCIGNSFSPGTNAVSIRTSNRNFMGRSGTKSASVYLTSIETAVASAIKGKLTDPRSLNIEYPEIEIPENFFIDDSMIVKPEEKVNDISIFRGPNIGNPPDNSTFPEEIDGIITIKVGDKITTDHITPAGNKLKFRSNIPVYSDYVFSTIDDSFSSRAIENKKNNIANIIVGGYSYGQGSSREHAAICPMYLGVKLIIAKSFERIHTANLINFGILPCTFSNESDYDLIDQGDRIKINQIHAALKKHSDIMLVDNTKNITIRLQYLLTDRQIQIILAGGMLNFLQKNE
jgi:aconitate hydratase